MAINRDKVLEAAQKFVEKKKYDRAVVELRKLVDADPNDARTLLKIGDLQAKQGLHGDAIATYESVGKLYSHQGFALKAIAVYKQIREIIAKHVPQLEERYGHIAPKLAELYQQLGLTSDALAALDEVATRLQRQQRDDEAIEVFRKIVELDPTNPLPHLRLAEALSRVKDTEGAVYEFKTAASQLAGIGRRDDALKVLERLLHHKADPEQAKICAELYLSRGQAQDGMQALAKLQICFQANPRDFDTLSLLARAFNAIGQGAKAIEVQKEMARVARDTGKTDLFREILERLVRVAPHDEGVRRLVQQQAAAKAPAHDAEAEADAPRHAAPQPAEPPAARQRHAQAAPGGQAAPVGWGPQGHSHTQSPPGLYGAPSNQQGFQRGADVYPSPQIRSTQSQPEIEEVEDLSYDEDLEEIVDEAEVVDDSETNLGEDVSTSTEGAAYGREEPELDAYGNPRHGYGERYREDAYRGARATATDEGGYDDQAQYATVDGENAEAYALDQVDQEPVSLSGVDPTEKVGKSLADANAFRRVRLYGKALETLQIGLDLDPRSMDLHEVRRDVLIESGDTAEAVQEMLLIASLYVDALDGDSAARALQDVLAFDPTNARAVEMLQELGYEIVDENEEGAAADGYGEVAADDPSLGYAADGVAEEDARRRAYDEGDAELHGASTGYGDSHRPYAGEQHGGALPSFPLDEPDAHDAYADAAEHVPAVEPRYSAPSPHQAYVGHENDDSIPSPPPDFDRGPSLVPVRGSTKPPSIGAAASRELEDALEEAEFFCSRGLFDDARAILAEQLGKYPNNPLLRERIAEVDAQEVQRGSGAREKPREQAERQFDLASSLDALEGLDYANIEPAEGHAGEEQQVDVEEVFAKFKEGVAKQISVEDSDSHYNLGIAYKEMLLLDDAIREFAVAAMDPKRECVCRSMIGMIQLERGNINEAIEAFLQGLAAPIKDPAQETALCYEIGAAYEAKKMNKDALTYYQKAMRRDPNYRDVQERVRRLAKNEPKPNLRQSAVGADDEFDRAFDDLLSKA